jgi:predicted AAA+ superfamily ATPase
MLRFDLSPTEDIGNILLYYAASRANLFCFTRSLTEIKTKQREINALNEAMAELDLKTGTVVTKAEENTISVSNGTINIVPAWKFLLQENI